MSEGTKRRQAHQKQNILSITSLHPFYFLYSTSQIKLLILIIICILFYEFVYLLGIKYKIHFKLFEVRNFFA